MGSSGIHSLGMILIQAFQKLPGFMPIYNDKPLLSSLQLISGVIAIIFFVIGIGFILVGLTKFVFKKNGK